MMPSPKPRKKRWYRNWMIISVIVLILLTTAGTYTGYKIITSTNTATATTQPTNQQPITPSTVSLTFGDGTYQVGNDSKESNDRDNTKVIPSGKYRTRTGSPGCHYTRIGDAGAIIANLTTDTTAIITILPTDVGFQSKKCGTWTNDLSPLTDNQTSFGDGMFFVGKDKDIKPGTYRIRQGSPGCSYARLNDFSGTPDAIIAQNTTDAPAIITIKETDVGFQSKKCGTWTNNLSPITDNQTPFGDGMYFVGKGKDIEPGTYKSTGGSGCSYARLSGFGGTPDDIIISKKPDKPTTVTILPKDVGFQSQGCGTWTKQSQQ